jgi:hypothetical protein
MEGRKRRGRKLLIATLGVAAVSYVGCSSSGSVAERSEAGDAAADGSPLDVVANLVAPDVGTDNGSLLDVVANLVAPDVGTE